MTERQSILRALINSEKEADFETLLFRSIDSIKLDVKNKEFNVYISPSSLELFQFVKEMYPKSNIIKEPKQEPKKDQKKASSLTFHNVSDKDDTTHIHNFLTATFSFYDMKKADFEFNLEKNKDGVNVYKNDNKQNEKNERETLTFNPYAICYSNKSESIQTFLEMIGTLKLKSNDVDVYMPVQTMVVLEQHPEIFTKIHRFFKSIMIHDIDGSDTSVTYSETGKTLHIYIKDLDEKLNQTLVKNSIEHILIDEKCDTKIDESIQTQGILNTLVSFPSKNIWTSTNENKEFYDGLSHFTLNGKVKNLHCFQYKKDLPDAKEKIRERMDRLVKLCILQPKISDILEIVNDTKFDTQQKIKKFATLLY